MAGGAEEEEEGARRAQEKVSVNEGKGGSDRGRHGECEQFSRFSVDSIGDKVRELPPEPIAAVSDIVSKMSKAWIGKELIDGSMQCVFNVIGCGGAVLGDIVPD